MKPSITLLVLFVGLTGNSFADVVTLKNGDRVTGTLETVKGGTLKLKSDILGELTIPMDKVATYSVEKPVAVIIKGQEPVEGNLELTPSGDWQVKAKGQEQTFKAATVDTIMPEDEYEKLIVAAPKPWQAWKGSINVGEGLQQGDQQTNTFTGTINAIRERPDAPVFQRHFRTNFGLATLLSHATENDSTVTSRTLSANLRQDYLFTPTDFFFGLAQADHVSTQGIYLRQTYGGGFGKDVVSRPHTTFSLIGGVTYQQQKFFNGELDQAAYGLVGEKLGEQFNKRMRLDNTFNFYPNFSQGGEYRFDTTTTFSIKISTHFSLNASVIDLYLSNPPVGSKTNNVTFSTGLGYTF